MNDEPRPKDQLTNTEWLERLTLDDRLLRGENISPTMKINLRRSSCEWIMISGAQCLFCLGDIGLAWRILECGAPLTLSRSPDTFTSNTFNTVPQDSHSPVPALRAPWTAFFSRVSTITEPCFTGTHRRALPVMRNAYYLVGLDGYDSGSSSAKLLPNTFI